MKRALGVLGLLVAICIFAALTAPNFLSAENVPNLIQRSALFGILSLGAAFVIVTGGIDLSIGSVVCVAGCLLPLLLERTGLPPALAIPAVLLGAAGIGLCHGLLVVGLRLQPFVVTLCGLLLYRGLMRTVTGDESMGLGQDHAGLSFLGSGRVPLLPGLAVPVPALVLLVLAVLTATFFVRTVPGRHLLALGRNAEAARLSGVATGRLTVLAYVACSVLAALGGMLFFLDVNSAQASSFGNFYELYAIAGAVLGGCALRGGELSVLGVVVGASVMQVLQNVIRLVGRSDRLEFAVVGAVILGGAVVDELVRRWWRRRRRGAS